MKLACILITAFTLNYAMQAQTIEWAQKFGGNPFDRGFGIATDAAGNGYMTGYFRSTAAFGSTTLSSVGGEDIYVAKFNADGDIIWATRAGGTGSLDHGLAIATDALQNSYVTGHFLGTATFGSISLTATGNVDAFIAKLDANGSFVWAKSIGGSASDVGRGIAADAAGNCYVTGDLSGTAEFGSTTLVSPSNDVFITKLDTDGNFLWARQGGGAQIDEGNGIAVDALGNCFVTGLFGATDDAPGSTATFGSTTLVSAGGKDVFISKLNSAGEFLWTVQAGGALNESGCAIATDAAGNCFVTGHFMGTADLGGTTLVTNAVDERDAFIAKLDVNGDFLWAEQAGGAANDGGFGVSTDASGNCFVSGTFAGSATFGSLTLTAAATSEVFIAKMNADGEFQWAQPSGGALNEERNGRIATDAAGNCFVTGWFRGEADFNGIELTASGSSDDIFVLKISDGMTSIHGATKGSGSTAFPNPTSSSVHIRADGPMRSVEIHNAAGVLVKTETRASFSVEQLPVGLYLLRIRTDEGVSTVRVVKE